MCIVRCVKKFVWACHIQSNLCTKYIWHFTCICTFFSFKKKMCASCYHGETSQHIIVDCHAGVILGLKKYVCFWNLDT